MAEVPSDDTLTTVNGGNNSRKLKAQENISRLIGEPNRLANRKLLSYDDDESEDEDSAPPVKELLESKYFGKSISNDAKESKHDHSKHDHSKNECSVNMSTVMNNFKKYNTVF